MSAFTCPRCGMTSHNPNDAREGYCGACHDWTALPGGVSRGVPDDFDVEAWVKDSGYLATRLVDGKLVAVAPMLFGKARLVIGDAYIIDHAYCYANSFEAFTAFAQYEPGVEPTGWFRCPTDGRRRPDGDPAKEYYAP